jgi:hypothetical protein
MSHEPSLNRSFGLRYFETTCTKNVRLMARKTQKKSPAKIDNIILNQKLIMI